MCQRYFCPAEYITKTKPKPNTPFSFSLRVMFRVRFYPSDVLRWAIYRWHIFWVSVVVISMWSEFACSTNQHSESIIKIKSPQTLAHLVNFSKNMSVMFDNHTIALFSLENKRTFLILSLCDLRFLLCSLDLDVLGAQRIIGFFILITHKSTRSQIRSRG